MNADEVRFVDSLPPKATGTTARKWGRWQIVAEQLKQQPGKWALVASGVNAGICQHLKKCGCDAVCRNGHNGKHDIYARWPEVAA